jgi:putative acetyltransferase
MSAIDIRDEEQADQSAIRLVTEIAFRDRPYAGGDEQDVIDRLRAGGALTLSMVALDGDELIGQITLSPAKINDGSGPWFALGPVSVTPTRQGEGIGAALINEGLKRIELLGALGCILTGNPDYYRRFGFQLSPPNTPANEPEEFFMLKLLKGPQPSGTFSFHDAFYGDA